MLYKVEVRTRPGDLLSLPLDDETSGFIVEEIEGLDPVKATLVSSGFAGRDGEQYQASKRESRNIKMRLGLNPDPSTETVRGLRKRLYSFFMPKSEVYFRFFMEDGLEVDIVGRVETCETALFTSEPAMDISIVCFDPDFFDRTPILVTGMTTADEDPTTIDYEGSLETGIRLVLNVNRTLPEFTVYHNPPSDDIRTLDFNHYPLVAGDVLTISTVVGDKGATLIRGGVTSSVLYGISPQSNWIELRPGPNQLKVYAEGAAVPLTVEYVAKYGGL